ncbi:hypothetical protein E2320_023023 [Naja naja]|nr:hypothetical protein E2320_023023 [Naja naja]
MAARRIARRDLQSVLFLTRAEGAGAGAEKMVAAGGAYSLGLANERLRLLEELEREIGAALQSAGTVILELSKEKPSERLLDRQAAQFGASVQKVATRQPHKGSSYAARKDCQMALKRVDFARFKLAELARGCEQMLEQ